MAKGSKISVNAFERVMNENYVPAITFEWHGIEVTVKNTLSLSEMLSFVDGVVKSCFDEDTHAYIPEAKEFAIKALILEKYANFTMPRNVAVQYALIYQTDAVECVLSYVNVTQFNEICAAIEKKVSYIAQSNIEAMNKQMSDLCNAFDNLQSRVGALFEGVSNDDLRAVASSISGGGVDEEKLVAAYLNINKGKNGG